MAETFGQFEELVLAELHFQQGCEVAEAPKQCCQFVLSQPNLRKDVNWPKLAAVPVSGFGTAPIAAAQRAFRNFHAISTDGSSQARVPAMPRAGLSFWAMPPVRYGRVPIGAKPRLAQVSLLTVCKSTKNSSHQFIVLSYWQHAGASVYYVVFLTGSFLWMVAM